jgi:hypothetical protein
MKIRPPRRQERHKRVFEWILLGVLGAVAVHLPAHAEERTKVENVDALLADISRARKDVKTLRASFTQERRIALLSTSVKSRGELTFATAPDRLRWDLAPPDDIVYFVGPEGLSYKTKSSSATVPAGGANIARALADLRALLGGDLASLRERYVLSATRSPADVEIAGTAKDKAASVKSFSLVLAPNSAPIRARLVEQSVAAGRPANANANANQGTPSDTIDLVFSNVVLNGPVDSARLKP